MIVHILENGNEIPLITYCRNHNIDFIDTCIRFCSGENFDEILKLPVERIKIIRFGKEEGENV